MEMGPRGVVIEGEMDGDGMGEGRKWEWIEWI